MNEQSQNSTEKREHYLICPLCQEDDLEFVTYFAKCLGLRVLRGILFFLSITILCCSLFMGLENTISSVINASTATAANAEAYLYLFIIAISLMFFVFIVSAMILYRESKTHVQAICRHCGHIWVID